MPDTWNPPPKTPHPSMKHLLLISLATGVHSEEQVTVSHMKFFETGHHTHSFPWSPLSIRYRKLVQLSSSTWPPRPEEPACIYAIIIHQEWPICSFFFFLGENVKIHELAKKKSPGRFIEKNRYTTSGPVEEVNAKLLAQFFFKKMVFVCKKKQLV